MGSNTGTIIPSSHNTTEPLNNTFEMILNNDPNQ